MHLQTRNVETAFVDLSIFFRNGSSRIVHHSSRNGPVLKVDEPVIVTYSHPLERVLIRRARDANPFFHLYHALWMLAGRNDVGPLSYYVKRMETFSDYRDLLNGAYGYRWRHASQRNEMGDREEWDQLDLVVQHLLDKPDSRRAVLQMWNVQDDLLGVNDLKDVCCNTSVMPSIKDGRLEITVTNRSNDLIWGCLGEDYVTFSILQEYIAARLGVDVGSYHHFSNDLHVYKNNWRPDDWSAESVYELSMPRVPLVKDPVTFETEVHDFVQCHSGVRRPEELDSEWDEPFFQTVAGPMMTAHAWRKVGNYRSALNECERIADDDWRVAATEWVLRRQKGAIK